MTTRYNSFSVRRLGGIVAGLLLMASGAVKAVPYVIDFDPDPVTSSTGGALDPNNDNFPDGDFVVEGFWYRNIPTGGSTAWTSVGGHFHIGSDTGSSGNVERQHRNGADQLQGIMIRRSDNGVFDLTSLDYRVRGTTSINGFSASDVKILLDNESFSASGTVAAEFTQFGVGTGSGSYSTLSPSGFCGVTRLLISSSASVGFDNITLDTGCAAGSSVPEPSSIALVGIAIAGLGFSLARRTAAKRV